MRRTVETIAAGLAAFDRSGRMILSNHQLFEVLDLPRGVGLAPNLGDMLMRQALRGDFGEGDPIAQVRERTEAFYRPQSSLPERFTIGGRTVQVRLRPMDGDIVLAIYSDITDRKAAEEKLTQAWVDADLGNRAKSEFLANMSHELRTPLNAIIGFSEVICEQMLGPLGDQKYLEYMHDIHASGMHLLAIVNDVLDMAKIEAGKLELRRTPIAVGAMFDESIRMVSERARSRSIRLTVDRLEAETVVADERAIKQVTLNLLSNAVKFSPDRGRVSVRALAARDGSFVLEVEDHGIGMTAAGIERALQPFGQVSTPETRPQSGTGLGLPITKGLVEAHGGSMVIESAAGRGTTVRVVLPQPDECLQAPPQEIIERAVA